jgi:hypothetical protein
VLRVKPGDVVVVMAKVQVSDEIAVRLHQMLSEVLPADTKVIVLNPELSLGVMRP